MKKLITKYWGLVLILVLLSSLFVAGAPVSASNYAWATSAIVPTAITGILAPAAGFGIMSAAASGSTIYATGTDTATNNYLYKSTDNGVTWVRQADANTLLANTAGTNVWGKVAVSPDDPNFVVVIDTGTTNAVWVSTTGGTYFSKLPAATGIVTTITSVTISPLTTARYVVIGGSAGGVGGVASWTMGLVSPSWTDLSVTTADSGSTNVLNVKFSPNFAADTGLVVVSVGASATTLNVYSYNIAAGVPANGWNTNGMYFPRTIASVVNMDKVSMVLDANFYLGDTSTQLGFIGVADTGTTTAGGVYRIDPGTTVTQIMGGVTTQYQINSVAWDGTNLMAGPYVTAAAGALTIYRSATATATIPTFLPSAAVKTPGTGTYPIVMFNGGSAFCFSQGNNSAVTMSMDLGKSFYGTSLVNSNFNQIDDFVVSPDGTRIYVATYDGTDVNLWERSGTTWQRVFIYASPAAAQKTWLVRMESDNPDVVFLGNKGATLMYKSTDGGVSWTIRGASAAIADFAVQDANTVYEVSSASSYVYKSTTGAFTWTAIPVTYLGGVGYSINLLAANSLVVGTTTGGVAYSNDGATFTTLLSIDDVLTSGNTVVTATGTGTGDWIFAGTTNTANTSGTLGRWQIGTSTDWGVTPGYTLAKPIVGIAYNNGILYALDDTNNAAYRFINPAGPLGYVSTADDTLSTGSIVTDQTNMVNQLIISNGSNVLWTRVTATPSDIYQYTDSMVDTTTIPVPTYPINNTMIPVNSVNGSINNFAFQWNAPPLLPNAPNQSYTYDVKVYFDEAGTILLQSYTYVAVSLGGTSVGFDPAVYIYYIASLPHDLNPRLGTIVYCSAISAPSIGGTNVGYNPVSTYRPAVYIPRGSFKPGKISSVSVTGATYLIGGTNSVGGQASNYQSISYTYAPPAPLNLQPGMTYYWQVRVHTPVHSQWSPMQSFVTEPLQAVVPVLGAPVNGATLAYGQAPAFSWNPIAGATSYSFELSTDPSFATTVYNTTVSAAGTNLPSTVALKTNTTYFWRVKALAPAAGDWSTVANFSIAAQVTTVAPTTVAPVTPTLTVVLPAPATTSIVIPAATTTTNKVNPGYIWAIVIIGAVLVIAVIVLIVRTRRSV